MGLKRTGELRQHAVRIALTRGPSSPHLMKRQAASGDCRCDGAGGWSVRYQKIDVRQ